MQAQLSMPALRDRYQVQSFSILQSVKWHQIGLVKITNPLQVNQWSCLGCQVDGGSLLMSIVTPIKK
jgi:hypothetical protein